jgi:ATPase
MYLSRNKVVKTIESPRDLVLGDEVTQYSLSHGSSGELQDILLLSRPDYTIFDEMRSTEDFRLFSDLRLSGVGMVGVVHATKPIDAVQRFLGRLDLGVIPHIIDTVIFIDSGGVAKVFLVGMDVKVPGGMTESDLARPVVTIHDFESGRLEFEIYTYGEENVIVPVKVESQTPILRLAESAIRREVRDFASKVDVDIQSDYKCRLVVPLGEKASFIGDGGLRIKDLENRLGLKIDVVEEAEKSSLSRSERKESINFSIKQDKKNILIDVGQDRAEVDVDIYVDDDFLFSARSSKKGVINISLGNAMGKMIQGSLASGRTLVVRAKLS